MKIVYVAHPISGNIQQNLVEVLKIVREINLKEPDSVPFAPYWIDCHALDDNNPNERARGIRNDVALFKKGFIDEVRLYGGTISSGMKEEVKMARQLNIKIVPMCKETATLLKEI